MTYNELQTATSEQIEQLNSYYENKNRYDAEELECVNTWLDKYNVPKEIDGNTYSTIGRIRWLIVFLRNSDHAKADKIYCDIFDEFYEATTKENKERGKIK